MVLKEKKNSTLGFKSLFTMRDMIVAVILVFDSRHEQCLYSGAVSDVQKYHLWIQGRLRCGRPSLLVRC